MPVPPPSIPVPGTPIPTSCKLANQLGAFAYGFPHPELALETVGIARVAVIPVDFVDAPAPVTVSTATDTVAQPTAEILQNASYGEFQLDLHPAAGWVRMPGPLADYTGEQEYDHYVETAVATADSVGYDFSGMDMVMIIGSTPETGAWQNHNTIRVDGTAIAAFVTTNLFSGDGPDIAARVTAHELAHLLSLPDLYRYGGLYPGDAGFEWEDYIFGDTGGFDFMGNVWNPHSPELFAWTRWQLGWIDDTQVVCVVGNTAEVSLSEVSSGAGIKALVTPISFSRAVVVEVRMRGGLDSPSSHQGALVYTVDMSVGSGHRAITVHHLPFGVDAHPLLDPAPLVVGQSLTVHGVTLEVLGDLSSGYRVRASR